MYKVKMIKRGIRFVLLPILCLLFFLLSTLLFYNDEVKCLGKGYQYDKEIGTISDKRQRKVIVPAKILRYKKEGPYLYVVQRPLEHDPNELLYDTVFYYKNGIANYYWIINTNNHSVLGPLDSIEFNKKVEVIKTL